MDYLTKFEESMLLMMIKAVTEGFAEPMKKEIKAKLLEIGIEADVDFNIKVLSVNPDTFMEAAEKKENILGD